LENDNIVTERLRGRAMENCKNCKWYAEFEGVCCNGESKHRADFMDEDSCCEKWEEVE